MTCVFFYGLIKFKSVLRWIFKRIITIYPQMIFDINVVLLDFALNIIYNFDLRTERLAIEYKTVN